MTIELSPVAARVLGSLVEKEITTPEYYPLSLNALVNASGELCGAGKSMSQKSARGSKIAIAYKYPSPS